MRSSSRSAVSAVLLAALFTSGCFGWGTQPTPAPSSTQRLPDPVRITRVDTSTLLLRDAAVSGDSIVGYAGDRQRVAVALADVRKVEGQEVDFLKTAGTSFVVTLLIGVVTTAVVLASLLSGG